MIILNLTTNILIKTNKGYMDTDIYTDEQIYTCFKIIFLLL